MSCSQNHEIAGEYVDGALDAESRRRFEQHLEACEECRALAADLARIRDAASSLPRVKPPDRTWARIAAEIGRDVDTRRAVASRRGGASGRFSWLGSWLPVPAPAILAAAVVILAVAGAYVFWPAQAPPDQAAEQPGSQDLAQSVQSELELAEKHYENAIAGLEKIRQSSQEALDPQVAETLDLNLAVIDKAIQDSKAALASQPGSQLAQESLFEAFRRKVSLLQDTIALINEMRKGNQAGAARIVGGFDKS